jgi:AcrR family transcriptional regulator
MDVTVSRRFMQSVAAVPDEPRVSVFAPTIPGLPSGYTGIPRELVEASQRQRLLYGVTAAVAGKGYGPTTIADVTAAAGVSKKTFYEHFADKLSCFLAAYDHGSAAMLRAVNDASRDASAAGAVEQLRHGNRAYLAFLVDEEPYARMFFLEMLAAGPEAVARARACRRSFTDTMRAWHEHARREHRDWPRAADVDYEAATAVAHELALERIATGRTGELAGLEDTLVSLQLAILRAGAADG